MGKVKDKEVEDKEFVSELLQNKWTAIGIDKPSNHDDIVEYCYEDVTETADDDDWHSGDVDIAFRRWIEEQAED